MIIPSVRKEEKGTKELWTDTRISINVCEEYADRACIALSAFLPQCTVKKQTEDAFITVQTEPRFASRPEAYWMEIKESGIVIGCADYMGLRNALAVFSVTVICSNGKLKLYETYIEDEPKASHRGAMLDLAGGIKPMESIYSDLILMAKVRMNRVQLYLFDRFGSAMELDSLPKACWMENAYTKQQMRDLCKFADALGLTVIPQFDMPAHSQKLLEVFEQFNCDVSVKEGTTVIAVCTGEPTLYEFYEKLIHEILDVFPGPYFHMGADEVELLDLNIVCYWDDCPRCRKLREEHHLADRQEQFYYFVKRIYDIVKKEGRILIMWSDQLDCPRGTVLPKDIIMHFWRVAGPGRGPYVDCSMNAQAALGYKIINSDWPETYTYTGEDYIMLTSDILKTWRWDREPDCEERYAEQILGSELCVWGYSSKTICSYTSRFLPSALALLGDKLWNNKELEYTEEYCCQLTRTLLGASTPEGLNVFTAIGDVLPPAEEDKYSYYERVTCSNRDVEAIIEALSLPAVYLNGDAARAEKYRACAEYTLKMKGNIG